MLFRSGIFQPIVDLMSTLVTYAFQLTQMIGYPSYGVAIILLTIVIKAILAPLTVKQIKSMKAMQELQPRMKQLQDKYKNDPAKLQAEMGASVSYTHLDVYKRQASSCVITRSTSRPSQEITSPTRHFLRFSVTT